MIAGLPRERSVSRRPQLMVVSPHCDDAVFACGDVLASHPGAIVVTVFAGRPSAGAALTSWDASAGFRPGDDVMGARREEDRAALAVLGATPVWLEFRERQYGGSPTVGQLATALERVIIRRQPAAVLIPIGLFHSDHKLVHGAGLALVVRRPTLRLFAYEDAIYRTFPGLLDERVEHLVGDGLRPHRVPLRCGHASVRKRWAVRCYRSQLRALSTPGRPGVDDAFASESLWALAT